MLPLLALRLALLADGDTLLLQLGSDAGAPTRLTRADLLSRADLETVLVIAPELGGQRQLSAVPLADLVDGLPRSVETIDIGCADGFVATFSRSELQGRDASRPRAYLAVERPEAPWAPFKGHSVGPFFLVWVVPAGGQVPREKWPYQVVRLAAGASLEQRYPGLVPPGRSGAPSRGFAVFATSCLPCHRIDGQGPSQVGPDLNQPESPLAYLGRKRLADYVRDPQSLHAWPEGRMPPFPVEVLGAAQLSDLLSYLDERRRLRH